MGDRGNIYFVDNKFDDDTVYKGMYLYTQYAGGDLWRICKDGLIRGENRWGDSQYLARILFCEMVRGIELETTGAGLGTEMGDNGHQIIRVNDLDQTVSFHQPGNERNVAEVGSMSWTYRQYVDSPWEDIAYAFAPERY